MLQFNLLGVALLCCGLCASVLAAPTPAVKETSVQWNAKAHAFMIGDTSLKIGVDAEAGYYDNQAEYASFGLERQLFKFSKIVIPVSIKHGHFFGHIDFAPLYDSVKSVNEEDNITYSKDSQGHAINGNNPYFDWYKNLGTRLYYLGDVPIVEAYASYQFYNHHQISAGRFKNHVGLADDETPWGDDGMFSPMSYWLSRDLFSGISYLFYSDYVNAKASFLSGNNPMKGYANYLDHIQSPNLKANNTPSYGANIDLNFGHLLNKENNSKLTMGFVNNTMSSTWVDELNDGKRRNSVYAGGLLIDLPFNEAWSLNIFGQYTRYLSGLSTKSAQNNGNSRFKNITQNGYFSGASLHYRDFSLSYTYETFDRFDANVYAKWDTLGSSPFGGLTLAQLEKMKQHSNIVNFKYQFSPYTELLVNYQRLNNPLKWVSDILDTKSDYRFSVALRAKF